MDLRLLGAIGVVVTLILLGWIIADLRPGVLLSLLVLGGLVFLFLVKDAVLYLLPAAFVFPNLGIDVPGPFAVLMWDGFTVTFVGGVLIRRVISRERLAMDVGFRRLLILFLAVAAVSLLQTAFDDPRVFLLGFKDYIRLVELALLLAALLTVLDTRERILLLTRNLVIASGVSLAIAFVGHFYLTDFFYNVMALRETYVLLGGYLSRMASTAGNVSQTGIFFLMSLGLTAFYARDPSSRYRIVAWLLCLALVVGILLTYNKGTWQAAFIGVIIGVIHSRMRIRYVVLVLLVALLAAVTLLYQEQIQGEISIIASDLSDAIASSGKIRLLRWLALAKVLNAHPFLGVGYNCFAYLYGQYAVELGAAPYGHPHNMYVDVMAGTGIVGFGVLLLLGLRLLRISIDNMRNAVGDRSKRFALHLHMVVWFFLAGNLTSSFFFKASHPAYLFVTVLALILALHHLDRPSYPDRNGRSAVD